MTLMPHHDALLEINSLNYISVTQCSCFNGHTDGFGGYGDQILIIFRCGTCPLKQSQAMSPADVLAHHVS